MATSLTKISKNPHKSIPCPLKCPICIMKYSDVQDLEHHVATHTGEFRYDCDSCDNVYSTEFELQLHKVCCHKMELFLVCTECGQNFNDIKCLRQHLSSHPNVDPSILMLVDSYFYTIPEVSKPKSDYALASKISFKCVVCDLFFSSKLLLKDHFVDNHRQNIYICQICNLTFILRSNLIVHKNLYHIIKTDFRMKKKPNSENIRYKGCNHLKWKKTLPMKETVKKKNHNENILSATLQDLRASHTKTTFGNGSVSYKFCCRSFKSKTTICRHKYTCSKKLPINSTVNKCKQKAQTSVSKWKAMRVSSFVTNKNNGGHTKMPYELSDSRNRTRTRTKLMKLNSKAESKLCPLTFKCKANLQRHRKFTCGGRQKSYVQSTATGMLKETVNSSSLEVKETDIKPKSTDANIEYDPQLDKNNQSGNGILTSINLTAIVSKEPYVWNVSTNICETEFQKSSECKQDLDINQNLMNQNVDEDFEPKQLPLSSEKKLPTQKKIPMYLWNGSDSFSKEDISMKVHKYDEDTEKMCNPGLKSNVNKKEIILKATFTEKQSKLKTYPHNEDFDIQKHELTIRTKLYSNCSSEGLIYLNKKKSMTPIISEKGHLSPESLSIRTTNIPESSSAISNLIDASEQSGLFGKEANVKFIEKSISQKYLARGFLNPTTKTLEPINPQDLLIETVMDNIRKELPKVECLLLCGGNKKDELKASETLPTDLKNENCPSSSHNSDINNCDNGEVKNMKQDCLQVDLLKPESCHRCGKNFTNRNGLRKHKKKHCRGSVCEIGIGNRIQNLKNDELKNTSHVIQDASAVDCDNYLGHFQKDEQHIGEKLLCVNCEKIFTSNGGLHKHQKKHCKGPVYSEKVKGDPIPNKKTEFIATHSKVKPQNIKNIACVKCEQCDRSFTSKRGLRKHQKKCCKASSEMVSGTPIQCEHCERSFTSRGGLLKHQKKFCKGHLDLINCFLCQQKFQTNSFYFKHLRKYHNLTKRMRKQLHTMNSQTTTEIGFSNHVPSKLLAVSSPKTSSNSKENLIHEVEGRKEIYPADNGILTDEPETVDSSEEGQSSSVWTFETLKDVLSPSDGQMSADTTLKTKPYSTRDGDVAVDPNNVSEFHSKLTMMPLDDSKEANNVILVEVKSDDLGENPSSDLGENPSSDCTRTGFLCPEVEPYELKTQNRLIIEEYRDLNFDLCVQVTESIQCDTTEVKLQILSPKGPGIADDQLDHNNDSGSSEDSTETIGALESVSIYDLQDLWKQEHLGNLQ